MTSGQIMHWSGIGRCYRGFQSKTNPHPPPLNNSNVFNSHSTVTDRRPRTPLGPLTNTIIAFNPLIFRQIYMQMINIHVHVYMNVCLLLIKEIEWLLKVQNKTTFVYIYTKPKTSDIFYVNLNDAMQKNLLAAIEIKICINCLCIFAINALHLNWDLVF